MSITFVCTLIFCLIVPASALLEGNGFQFYSPSNIYFPDQTKTITAAEDSFTYQLHQSTNYGSYAFLDVSYSALTGSPIKSDVWLKFFTYSLPPDALITSAQLVLYTRIEAQGQANISAYICYDDSWRENTITWANYPSYANGAYLDSVVMPSDSGTDTPYYWDVTEQAQIEADGDQTFSIVLNSSVADSASWFQSKDGAAAPYLPVLQIEYTTDTVAAQQVGGGYAFSSGANKTVYLNVIEGLLNGTDGYIGLTERSGTVSFYSNNESSIQLSHDSYRIILTYDGLTLSTLTEKSWNGTIPADTDIYIHWKWTELMIHEENFMFFIGILGIVLLVAGLMLTVYCFRHYPIFTLNQNTEMVWEKEALIAGVCAAFIGFGLIMLWLLG